MPGLTMLQSVGVAPSTGDATYLWLRLTPGEYLYIAGGRNSTTGSRRCTMLLCPESEINTNAPVTLQGTTGIDYLPLQGTTTQGAIGDWVMFKGRLKIKAGLNILVASFSDPMAGDTLRLVAGVDQE